MVVVGLVSEYEKSNLSIYNHSFTGFIAHFMLKIAYCFDVCFFQFCGNRFSFLVYCRVANSAIDSCGLLLFCQNQRLINETIEQWAIKCLYGRGPVNVSEIVEIRLRFCSKYESRYQLLHCTIALNWFFAGSNDLLSSCWLLLLFRFENKLNSTQKPP